MVAYVVHAVTFYGDTTSQTHGPANLHVVGAQATFSVRDNTVQ
jgi:hypothetical protein